jgi:hypothetical protein
MRRAELAGSAQCGQVTLQDRENFECLFQVSFLALLVMCASMFGLRLRRMGCRPSRTPV